MLFAQYSLSSLQNDITCVLFQNRNWSACMLAAIFTISCISKMFRLLTYNSHVQTAITMLLQHFSVGISWRGIFCNESWFPYTVL